MTMALVSLTLTVWTKIRSIIRTSYLRFTSLFSKSIKRCWCTRSISTFEWSFDITSIFKVTICEFSLASIIRTSKFSIPTYNRNLFTFFNISNTLFINTLNRFSYIITIRGSTIFFVWNTISSNITSKWIF